MHSFFSLILKSLSLWNVGCIYGKLGKGKKRQFYDFYDHFFDVLRNGVKATHNLVKYCKNVVQFYDFCLKCCLSFKNPFNKSFHTI